MALQTPGTPRRLGPPRTLSSVASSPNLSLSQSAAVARKASLNALVGKSSTPTSTMGADGHDLEVGDLVDVPGSMTGIVRFIGSVRDKRGVFAGVELSRQFASRGKNDGDVDGYGMNGSTCHEDVDTSAAHDISIPPSPALAYSYPSTARRDDRPPAPTYPLLPPPLRTAVNSAPRFANAPDTVPKRLPYQSSPSP